ncbi:MAG: hypothetical protein ABIQ60_04940 [Burkholderiaceae bacterium]
MKRIGIGQERGSTALSERRAINGLSLPGMTTRAPRMPGEKAKSLNVYVIDTSKPPKVFATF